MADEHPTSLSAQTTAAETSPPIASQQSSTTNDIIATESMIFQNSTMASVLSSAASPMLPQELVTIQGLDSGDATASFSVSDIVASSGSAIMTTDQIIPAEAEGLGVTEYQLVDNGNGEFIVVTSTVHQQKASGMADIVTAPNMGDQAETITLNLEEATQLLLQQQGLGRTLQLPDGTLQVVGNALMDKESLSLEVLQTLQGDFVQTLPTMDSSYGSLIEEKSESKNLDTVDLKEPGKDKVETEGDGGKDAAEMEIVPIAVSGTGQVELTKETDEESARVDIASQEKNDGNGGIKMEIENQNENNVSIELGEGNKTQTESEKQISKESLDKPKVRESVKEVQKEPDLNSPIPVTDQTIVMIKGKKCVLAFNEETQQMCAYPIKPPAGTKKRGRPKMTQEEKEALAEKRRKEREKYSVEDVVAPSEKSSAAETLLELSSVGADGVRRSARKRKKAKLLEEYEELEDSDEEAPFVDNQEKDPDITMNLPDLKKIKIDKEETFHPSLFTTAVAKRGRGRPRRYPPPGQSQIPTSIPAVIIPSPNGQQTLVMADIQNLRNLQRQLPNLVPKPPADANANQTTATPISTSTANTTEGTTDMNLALGGEADPLHLDSSEALDNQNIIPTALQGDTLPLVGGEGENAEVTEDNNTASDGTNADKIKEEPPSLAKESSDQLNQPTVIQIPENLFPMLGIKKDPIKIGLKASERELEKLKCPKCDFQGFYAHQYRAHIATHGDDIHKCKCCSYVSLDSEELLDHFKEFHPRCICPECDFMAEHAYIIKRHMMRHNAKSCTCHICGKVYKDMYILKMHVKMVHMPAEVLFECNVCSKKFTRKAHLKRHLRIHEPEKPFKCPHCEYRGCERSDISKHMLIHEEPKHVCERCGKAFRHIKNKELHVKRHYGQRDYKCGVCDFFGYTFTDIRKHIERKHQDMKTLICDKCNKHFRSEIALKEHQQVCNVMMIEQILAIPTSSGGTSQATIQIPTIVGPDGQRIILDGQTMAMDGQAIPLGAAAASQTISVDGKSITMGKQDGVNIVVAGQQLGLTPGEVEEEEELLELEDEEGDIDHHRTMEIIGEQIRIISHGSLVNEVTGSQDTDTESGQIVDIAESQIVIGATHQHNLDESVDHDLQSSSIAVVLQDETELHSQDLQNNVVAVDNGGSSDTVGTTLVKIEDGGVSVALPGEMDLITADAVVKKEVENLEVDGAETVQHAGVTVIVGDKEVDGSGRQEEREVLEEKQVEEVGESLIVENTETTTVSVSSLQPSS